MNPYSNLSQNAFWKSGVLADSPFNPKNIYKKKWSIPQKYKIATAGSCFAQHIAKHLKINGFNVIDAEPAPPFLPSSQHGKFGYSIYSARYGNIYTAQQLMLLAKEVAGIIPPSTAVWSKESRFFDALRPAIEPFGFGTIEEVLAHRRHHLSRVRHVFSQMDLLIFTLGLTEAWQGKTDGAVYPVAPGVIAGDYSDGSVGFVNFEFNEIVDSLVEFQDTVKNIRNGRDFRMIFTVSPVPLTATASGAHILIANTASKATLRAVAGYFEKRYENIDYFPSYEVITNPQTRGSFYEPNLRSVRREGVEAVMRIFFSEHIPCISEVTADEKFNEGEPQSMNPSTPDVLDGALHCEEQLLENFSK